MCNKECTHAQLKRKTVDVSDEMPEKVTNFIPFFEQNANRQEKSGYLICYNKHRPLILVKNTSPHCRPCLPCPRQSHETSGTQPGTRRHTWDHSHHTLGPIQCLSTDSLHYSSQIASSPQWRYSLSCSASTNTHTQL